VQISRVLTDQSSTAMHRFTIQLTCCKLLVQSHPHKVWIGSVHIPCRYPEC
jgi:hypothetical protein